MIPYPPYLPDCVFTYGFVSNRFGPRSIDAIGEKAKLITLIRGNGTENVGVYVGGSRTGSRLIADVADRSEIVHAPVVG